MKAHRDVRSLIQKRAGMLARARAFFAQRSVLEVDCPLLSASASVDAHIDLIPAFPKGGQRYLHSSPEYGMKRLLAEGSGDIYQLSHVFRDGEYGVKHNPEFMMAEWYRIGFTFEQLIEETIDFCRLFLGDLPHTSITYREAFQRYAGFDYLTISDQQLQIELKRHGIAPYESALKEGREALLNLILATVIEPQLGRNALCSLKYYPASQAALAQTRIIDNEEVGERFEVYYNGMELANGYHELADPVEQRHRLESANIERIALGKEALPIDELFLAALDRLPDCCGVAVGFDRLLLLMSCNNFERGVPPLDSVLLFHWENA